MDQSFHFIPKTFTPPCHLVSKKIDYTEGYPPLLSVKLSSIWHF